MTMLDRVIVRFKSSSGAGRERLPSESLNHAMVSLAESDEMRPLLHEVDAEGKVFAIDIVQDRTGRPIFVHFTKEEL